MEKFKRFFKKDRFATSNGIELVECRPGYAKAQVRIEERHLNGADVVHGGLLFTLADFCFAAAVNSYGVVSLSISASMSFFAKSSEGIITAECKEISRSNRLVTCDINVTDEQGRLLANLKGTAYITKGEIRFE
jgi:acyl-CoA thioesterase